MATIKLDKEVEVVIRPAEVKKFAEIQIERIVDRQKEKKVIAFFENGLPQVTLWEGEEYDKVGQWTDADVATRLKEHFEK